MKPLDQSWPIDQAVMLACLLEASAPKLGNVHPGRAFDDMHFGHFLASAMAVSPIFADPTSHTVGSLVLAAVTATRQRVGCNTNLGTAATAGTVGQGGSESAVQRSATHSGLPSVRGAKGAGDTDRGRQPTCLRGDSCGGAQRHGQGRSS